MATYKITRDFKEFCGIDAKSNHVVRDQRYAVDAVNVLPSEKNDLTLRQGSKAFCFCGDASPIGPGFSFNSTSNLLTMVRRNNITDLLEDLLISLDVTVQVVNLQTFVVTYSGAGTASCAIQPELVGPFYSYWLTIKENGAVVFHKNIGIGWNI